jgi:TPR repeat protein
MAMCLLATMYKNGSGVPRDDDAALQWFQRAAQKGSRDGHLHLSYLYGEEGERKNLPLALEHLHIAAANGHKTAEQRLGHLYVTGKDVGKDVSRGFALLRSSADKGDMRAQSILGNLLARGDELPVDRAAAIDWFQKAAEQGDLEAKYSLVVLHTADGIGTHQTVAYCREAAAAGCAAAQYLLAVIYLGGQCDLPCDPVIGRAWLEKAAAQDYAGAKWFLAELPPPHLALSCRQCLADKAPLKCGRCRYTRYCLPCAVFLLPAATSCSSSVSSSVLL